MIPISNEEIRDNMQLFYKEYQDSVGTPLYGSKLLSRYLPLLGKKAMHTYPRTVNLPKDINQLLAGDFSPGRVLTLNEPIMGPYGPIWFGNTTKEVFLRFGYFNGDSRALSDIKFSDSSAHAVLAGMTGSGKSVAILSAVEGMCCEYAPWELNLVLCDAKVVSFKNLALNTPFPHIRSVAATQDTDYIVSVLQNAYDEMLMWNSIYATTSKMYGTSVQNIMDFRKVTGLTVPRTVIIIDEFQTLLTNAGKKTTEITNLFKLFTKLGRNTGFHLFLASQELGSEMPKEVLENVTIRTALGCSPAISELILGNDAAKKYAGRKGMLTVNLNSVNKRKDDNKLIKVSWMPPADEAKLAQFLIDAGKRLNVAMDMQFYDEQDMIHEKEYRQKIEQFPARSDTVYLGEPAFVLKDPDHMVKLKYTGTDIDGIMVFAANNMHLKRYFKMLTINLTRDPKAKHLIWCAKDFFIDDCGANQAFNTDLLIERDGATSETFNDVFTMLTMRKLALDVDAKVFRCATYDEKSDSRFYKLVERGSELDNSTNRSRCYYFYKIVEESTVYKQALGIGSLYGEDLLREIHFYCNYLITMCASFGAANAQMTKDLMPTRFFWVLGLDAINGIGRNYKSNIADRLVQLYQDGFQVNMHVIAFTNNVDEISFVKQTCVRWYIVDDLSERDPGKIKFDDYPQQKSAVVGVLFDAIQRENSCKFKKLILDGEIISV